MLGECDLKIWHQDKAGTRGPSAKTTGVQVMSVKEKKEEKEQAFFYVGKKKKSGRKTMPALGKRLRKA